MYSALLNQAIKIQKKAYFLVINLQPWLMTNTQHLCEHLSAITDVKTAKAYVCEECVRLHTHWLHLRTCQTCGITLCCDDSPHKHMTAHYHKVQHPVISSSEPGERWLWCYPDQQVAEY